MGGAAGDKDSWGGGSAQPRQGTDDRLGPALKRSGRWRSAAWSPEMLLIRGKSHLHRVWPPDPLKLRRDLGVIQIGMVPAVAADEFKHAGVAAFRPALHDAGRLAPQNHRPAMPLLATPALCLRSPF